MLTTVEQLYPARRYVMVDDKVRLLSAMKSILGDRLTTVFLRQGHYAFDMTEISAYPIPDITIEAIGDIGAMEGRRWGSP